MILTHLCLIISAGDQCRCILSYRILSIFIIFIITPSVLMRVDNNNNKHPTLVGILCSCVITINLSSHLLIIDLVLIDVINYSEAVSLRTICNCHPQLTKLSLAILSPRLCFLKENILVCL